MYFKLTLLTLLFLGWANVAILFLVVNLIISNFGKRIFAGFCAKMVDDYNKVSNPMKIELFKELNDMRRGEKISVLEVGAGPGANFKYFNRDAIQFCRDLHFFLTQELRTRAKLPRVVTAPLNNYPGLRRCSPWSRTATLRATSTRTGPGFPNWI